MFEQENDLSSGFSSKNKSLNETNSAMDSGFLSGPQDYSDKLDSGYDLTKSQTKEHQPKIQIDTTIDSGIIEDRPETMRTTGLLDNFSNLTLKDRTTNDLNEMKNTKVQEKKQDLDQLVHRIFRPDNDGDTQLHLAIINEIPHIIAAIIRLAPAPWLLDLKNDDAQAPIHLAAHTRQPNVIRQLIVAGAKASIRDGDGNTPLHLACLNDDLASVKALLEPITTAELKEFNQMSNQLPQLKDIRSYSIDLEQKNFYGENCVHIAAERNQIQILEMLNKRGADINQREGRAGYTPLHIAVEQDNLNLARFLLEQCKNLNTETLNYRQFTAYELACKLKYTEMMETLSRFGCELISPPESDYDDSDDSDDIDSDLN